MTPKLVVVRPAPRSERITIFVSKDTKRHLVAEAARQRRETGSKKIKPATIAADYVESMAEAAGHAEGAGLPRRRTTDHAA